MSGSKSCSCGRTISATAQTCRDCASKPQGALEILNVQGGDVKIAFDKASAGEVIRAKRIIQDMLRRGYALIVEVERNGERAYERIKDFDAERGEYIIADFDSLEAAKADAAATPPPETDAASPRAPEPAAEDATCHCGRPLGHKGPHRKGEKRLPMTATKATAIGRSAGG